METTLADAVRNFFEYTYEIPLDRMMTVPIEQIGKEADSAAQSIADSRGLVIASKKLYTGYDGKTWIKYTFAKKSIYGPIGFEQLSIDVAYRGSGPDIPEKPPVKNEQPAVWDLVIDDMKKRDNMGRAKYGTPLQPFNGRDALWDLYQELLDSVVYLRQLIYETENK